MIDLHVHSTNSDGSCTPKELVDIAIKSGITAFALTDHDTTAGLDEAFLYAEKLKGQGIENIPEIIPGIELSAEYLGKDVHIVGLCIDYKSRVFSDYLSDFIKSREERNETMCKKLVEHGIDITYSELLKEYPDRIITRAHFSDYLIKHNYVKSKEEAFDRYIGDNAPCFIPRKRITPADAIKLILKGGGIPVLAHPMLYRISVKSLENLVSSLKEEGLIGIEGLYCTYTKSDERTVCVLANKYHLLLSGGSDFHGTFKPNLSMGTGYGKLNIPEVYLTELKRSIKRLLFTDLDGTLLLNDSTISDSMRFSLKSMTDKGHRLILTSGRPLPSILEVKDRFNLNFNNMYIIAMNGAIIYDCSCSKIVHKSRILQPDIQKIVEIVENMQVHIHGYSDTEIIGTTEDKEIEFYRRRIHMPFMKVNDLSEALSDGTYKLQIISLDNKQKLIEIRDIINRELGKKVNAFFSNDYYLEILPKDADKGSAICMLTSLLPAMQANTFAAGDAENDIPMIKAAAHGIAMKNADAAVKAYADIITQNDNDNNGLIEIIDRYFT